MTAEFLATGALLVGSMMTFGAGATIPLLGREGDPGIYTLPTEEHLAAVGRNQRGWRWANILMGAAVVALCLGLAMLSLLLADAGARVPALLGIVSFLVAATMWVALSTYRATVTIWSSREVEETGTVPAYHAPIAEWAGALFQAYAVLGFLSLVAYGAGIVLTGLVAPWAGWATIVFSVGLLGHLLVSGDTLPAFHYLPPLLIGILLLVAA